MATIIKREKQHPEPAGRSVRGVAFDFEDLAGHADEYLGTVRSAAAKIVQEAHAEAERVRAQAEKAGREAAEAAIESLLDQKVAQQMATLRPALDAVVTQLTDARGAWLDHWDQASLGLAARMAERVVRSEIADRPDITLGWVREALELAAGAPEVTIRLHPEDHKNLGSQAETIAEAIGGLAPTRVVADGAVSRGGCVVNTRHGSIDQQVESQLNRLVEDLG